MRLVIIKSTGTVGKDGVFAENVDLSSCGLPENFWALQWNEYGGDTGHIEFNTPNMQNQEISELPSWVDACLVAYQEKRDQDAAELAAEAAALANASASQS